MTLITPHHGKMALQQMHAQDRVHQKSSSSPRCLRTADLGSRRSKPRSSQIFLKHNRHPEVLSGFCSCAEHLPHRLVVRSIALSLFHATSHLFRISFFTWRHSQHEAYLPAMNPSTISPGIAKTVANDSYLPLEVLPSKTGSRGDRSTAANLHLPATRRARSQSPDSVSLLSNDDFSELRRIPSAFSNTDDPRDGGLLHGQGRSGVRGQLQTFWVRNKGLALVLLAQMFGTCMNIGTRLLENLGKGEDGEGGMHPFQIIFARMSMTTVLSVAYMAYTKTPDFPFGAKGIRLLLVARGTGGFFGVFGLYCTYDSCLNTRLVLLHDPFP